MTKRFFKAAPDQLNSKPGEPSETSRSIVADMIAQQREMLAQKKKAAAEGEKHE
jgi:hypothetical protein